MHHYMIYRKNIDQPVPHVSNPQMVPACLRCHHCPLCQAEMVPRPFRKKIAKGSANIFKGDLPTKFGRHPNLFEHWIAVARVVQLVLI